MSNNIDAKSISHFLSAKLIGQNRNIKKIVPVHSLVIDSLSFITKASYPEELDAEGVVIVSYEYKIDPKSKNSYIVVQNPKLAIAKIIVQFFEKKEATISPKASISSTASIGSNVFIGDNVVIEDDVHIESFTIIGANSVIHKGSCIGKHCRIGANSVIGNEGLNVVKDLNKIIPFRHIGIVVIEDYVEIGPCSTVGKGTLDKTIIKTETKIGPQVNIGHNTIIGSNCIIAGRTHISGSVLIGNNVKLWANCSISDGIIIGNNAQINIGSVVIKNVKEDQEVSGNFAYNHQQHLKNFLKAQR